MFAAVLIGCVPPSHELRAPVDRVVAQRTGATALRPDELDRLLAAPLDRAAVVRVALANSPRLRAAFDELDIAAGDVAAALGLGPVSVDAKVVFGKAHDEYELDAVQNVIGLVTLPSRRAAARAEQAAVRADAAATALRLAARVEIAFADLLAAQQAEALRQSELDAAMAAAALRERMRAAGNTSELALARELDAREQAQLAHARATLAVTTRREALNALLGLSGARTNWTTRGALDDVPEAAPALESLEADAASASLELAAGRARRDAADHRVTVERLHTVLPELGVGVAVTDDGHQRGIGPAVQLSIPLFDLRSGPRAVAHARVRQADHALAAQRLELSAAARAARATAIASHAEARRLHDVVLPLRKQILDQTLAHYNAMDADPFTLIVARRELADAAQQYVDATRRYWNAMSAATALSRGVMIEDRSEPAASDSPRAHSSEEP